MNNQNNLDETKLDQLIEIENKNHEILRKLHRYNKIKIIWNIIYWTIVIISLLIAYYSLSPVYKEVISNYQSIINNIPIR